MTSNEPKMSANHSWHPHWPSLCCPLEIINWDSGGLKKPNTLPSWRNSAKNYTTLICRKLLFLPNPKLHSYSLAPLLVLPTDLIGRPLMALPCMSSLHRLEVIIKQWCVSHFQPKNRVQCFLTVCLLKSTQGSTSVRSAPGKFAKEPVIQ